MRRIPALVVSGFLGSGKTTLVRRLLADAQAQGVRVALVSNELGELGIDAALLGRMRDDYVELRGGCVCCKLSDQLVETLEMLRRRADPDRVIVETSGVALPYDTQLNFWREPVAGWIADVVAVVVVNAEQLAAGLDLASSRSGRAASRRRAEGLPARALPAGSPQGTPRKRSAQRAAGERRRASAGRGRSASRRRAGAELAGIFEQQVSSADLLVLNQLDRVPEAAIPELEARLREIEPEAPILRAVHADVDPQLLFPPDPSGRRARRRSAPSGSRAAAHADHRHERFLAEEVAVEAGIAPEELLARLRRRAALRVKGFARTREGLRVVQGVGPRIELSPPDAEPPSDLVGRLVVIRRA
jgi:cobalamin biosynthesis protein CobW